MRPIILGPKAPQGATGGPKRVSAGGKGSQAEELLAFQLRAAKLPAPIRQWRFAAPRKYTADFGWPVDDYAPLAVEIQGGIWLRGQSGHSSGTGILRDILKAQEYALRGIRYLPVTPDQVKSGEALQIIERLLRA